MIVKVVFLQIENIRNYRYLDKAMVADRKLFIRRLLGRLALEEALGASA